MVRHRYDDGSADLTDDSCEDVVASENVAPEDAATQADVEDRLLASIAIDQALEQLPVRERAVIELLYAYRPSPGYTGPWCPDTLDVRRYLSVHVTQGAPVPRSTLWAWHDAVLARWRRQRRGVDVRAAVERRGLSLLDSSVRRRAA